MISNKSHLTAMSRQKPSAPMVRLKAAGRLKGRTLDYGCGKGYDAQHFDMESFDPHYQPVMPEGKFNTITCNYVLNVIESPEQRLQVTTDILARLKPGGLAYITVRNDKKSLNGTTSKGTWQGHVVLDLPVVQRGSGFVTYVLSNFGR